MPPRRWRSPMRSAATCLGWPCRSDCWRPGSPTRVSTPASITRATSLSAPSPEPEPRPWSPRRSTASPTAPSDQDWLGTIAGAPSPLRVRTTHRPPLTILGRWGRGAHCGRASSLTLLLHPVESPSRRREPWQVQRASGSMNALREDACHQDTSTLTPTMTRPSVPSTARPGPAATTSRAGVPRRCPTQPAAQPVQQRKVNRKPGSNRPNAASSSNRTDSASASSIGRWCAIVAKTIGRSYRLWSRWARTSVCTCASQDQQRCNHPGRNGPAGTCGPRPRSPPWPRRCRRSLRRG